jgi:hypothetical protein
MGTRFRETDASREENAARPRAALMPERSSLFVGSDEQTGIVCYDLAEDYMNELDRCYQRLRTRHCHLCRRHALARRSVMGLLPVSILLLGISIASLFVAAPLEVVVAGASLAVTMTLLLHRLHAKYQHELRNNIQRLNDLYTIYLELFRAYEIMDAQKRGEAIEAILRHKMKSIDHMCE